MFGLLNASGAQAKADLDISDAMSTYWTNFAKYGDPNGAGKPQWPAYSPARPVVMYFSQTAHTGPVPDLASLKVLDAYFRWRRSPDGQAGVK